MASIEDLQRNLLDPKLNKIDVTVYYQLLWVNNSSHITPDLLSLVTIFDVVTPLCYGCLSKYM